MSVNTELELRRRRAAQNQSIFREVNERIEELVASSSSPAFVCECADHTCDGSLPLSIGEYEQLRSDGNRFVVLPGHILDGVEEIVEETERYLVVAKLGSGAAVAASLDPRGGGAHSRRI